MTYKAHFDGHAIVLDEPAALAPGQAVRVTVDEAPPPADGRPWMAFAGVSRGLARDGARFIEELRREDWGDRA